MAEKQEAKRQKLEKIRSFRTSKRKIRRNKEVTKDRKLKLRIVLYVTKNSNVIVIETERKHLVEI